MADFFYSRAFAPVACAAVIVGAFLVGATAPIAPVSALIVEGGPVETASVVLHLVAAAAALALMVLHRRRLAGVLAFASLAMAAREMDLHRAFTTHGVFSTRFYVRPEAPWAEKIGAALVLLVLTALFFALLWRARRELKALIARRSAAFYSLAVLPVFIIALKEVDGLPRMLGRIGVQLSDRQGLISHMIEEVGEMTIPLLTAVILAQIVHEALDVKPSTPSLPVSPDPHPPHPGFPA